MKSILLVLSIFCFAGLSAQETFDKRLLAKFSKERIQELQKDHSSVIDYWTFYLDNSYEILEAPIAKDLSNLPEIDINRKKEFNILEYNIGSSADSNSIYRISNSTQILVVKSTTEITKAFNEFRKSNTIGS